MTLDTLRRDLRALRVELAAARLTGVLRRWGATSAEEAKYDPHAVHQPAGTRIAGRGVGGQFAPKGGAGGGALREVAARAARAVLADPQAAAAAGPGAAALAAGGVAISRQAGLYAHYMDGQAITPILHLPGGKLETGPPPLTAVGSGRQRRSLAGVNAQCDADLQDDLELCDHYAKKYSGKGGYSSKQIFAICSGDAMFRYSECLTGKPRRPMFTGEPHD